MTQHLSMESEKLFIEETSLLVHSEYQGLNISLASLLLVQWNKTLDAWRHITYLLLIVLCVLPSCFKNTSGIFFSVSSARANGHYPGAVLRLGRPPSFDHPASLLLFR